MKKIILVLVALVILVLIIVGFANKDTSGKEVKETYTVKVGYLQVLSSFPLYIAETNNLFTNKDIKIEKVVFSSSNQLVDALVRGDVDVSPSISVIPILAAELVDSGKLKIFYNSDLTIDKPFDNLIVKTDSPIKKIADLSGKKIGIFPGTTQKSIIKKYLADKNIDSTKISFVELPPQNQLLALSQGSVDVLQAIEPNRTIAIETGLARAINKSTYAETYDHIPFVVGVISTKFSKQYPKLANKVISVFSETNQYLKTNESKSREIIGKAMNLEKNIYDKVVLNEYVLPDSVNLNKFTQFLINIEELKSKPNVESMIYNPQPEAGDVVRVGHLQIMASKLPFEIAKRKGFFEEEGIKIQATELQSSNLLLDALIRGDIDVTPEISLFPYMSAELVDPGKLKIFSVTDLTQEAPFDSIIVKSDSSIKTINDLSGKKIGVSPGTTATNMLKLFLKNKNVDTSAVQFIQIAPATQLQGLASGSIDALFAYEPTISIATKSQNMKVIYGSVFADIVDHNPLGGGLIRTEFINEHSEDAKKIVRAINKSYDFIKNNPEETRKIMGEVFNITNPDVLKSVSLTQFNYLDKIDLKIMDKFLDSVVSAGEIKSKPDLSNAFYKQ